MTETRKKNIALVLNLVLILVELIILALIYYEYVALGYGWDGEMKNLIMLTTILIQGLLLLLISRVKGTSNQTSLYYGQLLLFGAILTMAIIKLELHYKHWDI